MQCQSCSHVDCWKWTCATLLAVTLCTSYVDATSATEARPNVILVMTDDQGYGDLSCHGNPVLQTPHLDALYRDSVRLTDFHVDPTCSPTRAALLTGRYSLRTGIWHTVMGRSLLRENEVTLADILAAAGYRTAIFGKWHLGDNYPLRPQDRGFQESLVCIGGGITQIGDCWGNDYFDDVYYRNGQPEQQRGYCTDIWFDNAIRFIGESREAKQPFFVYVAPNAPHYPYNVPPKYEQLYKDREGVPNAAFYGMIANIDDNIGRLLRHLEAEGLSENTIVIFMTDNGTAEGYRELPGGNIGFNAGMRGQKATEFNGGHRVPFFIRWPAGRINGGKDVDRLTAHIDVLPTLLELCNVERHSGPKLDGRSFVSLLEDSNAQWPQRTLLVDQQRIEHPKKWRMSVVMTERWRLLHGHALYDIKNDPAQQRDVAAEHPGVVAELRTAYEQHWNDLLPTFDDYVEIGLGSDQENPVHLNCMDWHDAPGAAYQTSIVDAAPTNGFWAVRVEKAGRYRIQLRRWPMSLAEPINAGPGKHIAATHARVRIMDVDEKRPIEPGAHSVDFEVELDAGEARLQTWFTSADAEICGAYYVTVTRLDSTRLDSARMDSTRLDSDGNAVRERSKNGDREKKRLAPQARS